MNKQLAPLRKVLDFYVNDEGIQRERLECGHEINRKQDIYGYTNAGRRRCRFCLKEALQKSESGADTQVQAQ